MAKGGQDHHSFEGVGIRTARDHAVVSAISGKSGVEDGWCRRFRRQRRAVVAAAKQTRKSEFETVDCL